MLLCIKVAKFFSNLLPFLNASISYLSGSAFHLWNASMKAPADVLYKREKNLS